MNTKNLKKLAKSVKFLKLDDKSTEELADALNGAAHEIDRLQYTIHETTLVVDNIIDELNIKRGNLRRELR